MPLTDDETKRVEDRIRQLLANGVAMRSHKLVQAVVESEDLEDKREDVQNVALRMTKPITSGPDRGKVVLDEPS